MVLHAAIRHGVQFLCASLCRDLFSFSTFVTFIGSSSLPVNSTAFCCKGTSQVRQHTPRSSGVCATLIGIRASLRWDCTHAPGGVRQQPLSRRSITDWRFFQLEAQPQLFRKRSEDRWTVGSRGGGSHSRRQRASGAAASWPRSDLWDSVYPAFSLVTCSGASITGWRLGTINSRFATDVS